MAVLVVVLTLVVEVVAQVRLVVLVELQAVMVELEPLLQ
jgi:hypothetical protein